MGGPSGRGRVAVIAATVPLVILVVAFALVPTLLVLRRAWELDHDFGLGLLHVEQHPDPWFGGAVRVGLVSTAIAVAVGGLLSVALGTRRRPGWLADGLDAWARARIGVGGVPLTFAFVVAVAIHGVIGRTAAATAAYRGDLRLAEFWDGFAGRVLADVYLLVPLVMLVLVPVVAGIPREWSQAAALLGCRPATFVRRIVAPLLLPAVAGAAALALVTSVTAAATARALAGIGHLAGLGHDLPTTVVERELRLVTVSWVIALLLCTLLLTAALQRRSIRMAAR